MKGTERPLIWSGIASVMHKLRRKVPIPPAMHAVWPRGVSVDWGLSNCARQTANVNRHTNVMPTCTRWFIPIFLETFLRATNSTSLHKGSARHCRTFSVDLAFITVNERKCSRLFALTCLDDYKT